MEVERVEIKNKLYNILSIFTKTNIKTDSNSENQNLILEEKKPLNRLMLESEKYYLKLQKNSLDV